jgi:hypothetical protein
VTGLLDAERIRWAVGSVHVPETANDGSNVSVAAIARRAGVDRTFICRRRDLLGQIHAQAAEPPTVSGGRGPASSAGPPCKPTWRPPTPAPPASQPNSVASNTASEVLGDEVWREAGIGGPDDTERLRARITTLEQQAVDPELRLQERDDDLAAARAAKRELISQLNRHSTDQPTGPP